ncbi:MAG: hypothetical protein KJO00_06170 [Bacteroidia bacterium]|nr:hypothetical protein [Bacteroidia bacterium]
MILFTFIILLLLATMLMIILEFDCRDFESDDVDVNSTLTSESEKQETTNDFTSHFRSELNNSVSDEGTVILNKSLQIDHDDYEMKLHSLSKELKRNLSTLSYIHYLEANFKNKIQKEELKDLFEIRSKMRIKTIRISRKLAQFKMVQDENQDESAVA